MTTNGIVNESTCLNASQQNRTVKRKNKYLLKVGRSLLFARNVPKLHWGDVVLIASYLINRMPTQVLENKNSLETLKNYFPPITSCSSIPSKAFGCNVFMHIPDRSQAKLCHKSNNCIFFFFLGYSPPQDG